jgi:hypothetical protein
MRRYSQDWNGSNAIRRCGMPLGRRAVTVVISRAVCPIKAK